MAASKFTQKFSQWLFADVAKSRSGELSLKPVDVVGTLVSAYVIPTVGHQVMDYCFDISGRRVLGKKLRSLNRKVGDKMDKNNGKLQHLKDVGAVILVPSTSVDIDKDKGKGV